MAVQRPFEPDSDRLRAGDSRDPLSSPSRYDVALLAIPVAFLLAAVAHVVLGVPFAHTAVASAAVGVLVLVDGLFLNPPAGPQAR